MLLLALKSGQRKISDIITFLYYKLTASHLSLDIYFFFYQLTRDTVFMVSFISKRNLLAKKHLTNCFI